MTLTEISAIGHKFNGVVHVALALPHRFSFKVLASSMGECRCYIYIFKAYFIYRSTLTQRAECACVCLCMFVDGIEGHVQTICVLCVHAILSKQLELCMIIPFITSLDFSF